MAKPEDPRVTAFKRAYMDATNTKTFCCVRQSALAAGFSQSYAENLSGRMQEPRWWKEFKESQEARRVHMLQLSEKHFNDMLTQETEDIERIKLKQRTSEFVSERVGKEIYSTRQELTGKAGRRLFDTSKRDQTALPIAALFKGVKATEK